MLVIDFSFSSSHLLLGIDWFPVLANVVQQRASCRPVLCPVSEWRVQNCHLNERSTYVLPKYEPRKRRVNVFENTSKRVLKDGYLSHGWLVVEPKKDLTFWFQIRYVVFTYFQWNFSWLKIWPTSKSRELSYNCCNCCLPYAVTHCESSIETIQYLRAEHFWEGHS